MSAVILRRYVTVEDCRLVYLFLFLSCMMQLYKTQESIKRMFVNFHLQHCQYTDYSNKNFYIFFMFSL